MSEVLLQATGLRLAFGGVKAADGIDLSVMKGEFLAIIGPNGAGKTTTFNVITGLQAPTRGFVHLDGTDITGLSAHQRARAGIARTFQRLELFGSLSVFDNVLTAAELRAPAGNDPRALAGELLARVGLEDVADRRADSLSTGSARLVELARALACAPRVLLLDEPASGLDDRETERFAEILVRLARDGLGILIVEHDVPLVMRLCTQITVLNFGEVLACGTPTEVQRDPAVIDAYLGQEPT